MISAVIVEDEKLIRRGLETHIPWKELGVDQIYSAQQAEEAFEICGRVKPDIIVSDIRMPGMDGIELCRKLREQFKDSQIIFVTGFSDKEYLKAAIELHAVSYVEKPVQVKELSEAVANAVEQVRRSRSYEKAVAYSVFTNSDRIGFAWTSDEYFTVGLLYFKNPEDKNENSSGLSAQIRQAAEELELHCAAENVSGKTEAFLFSGSQAAAEKRESLMQAVEKIVRDAGCQCYFSFGDEIRGREAISESYQSAQEALGSLSYRGWNGTGDAQEKRGNLADLAIDKSWMDPFTRTVTQKNRESAREFVRSFTAQLKEHCIYLDADVKYFYYAMENMILRFQGKGRNGNLEGHEQIEKAETLDELTEYICRMTEEQGEEEQNSSYLVQRVTDYMQEHYREADLSIKTLADQVYLTPTYLSNLYKKHRGTTIGQYLVDIRIRHAVDLLGDPKWKLYQISEMVGYEDPKYFAKIFKKKMGITPSEYREKMVL